MIGVILSIFSIFECSSSSIRILSSNKNEENIAVCFAIRHGYSGWVYVAWHVIFYKYSFLNIVMIVDGAEKQPPIINQRRITFYSSKYRLILNLPIAFYYLPFTKSRIYIKYIPENCSINGPKVLKFSLD